MSQSASDAVALWWYMTNISAAWTPEPLHTCTARSKGEQIPHTAGLSAPSLLPIAAWAPQTALTSRKQPSTYWSPQPCKRNDVEIQVASEKQKWIRRGRREAHFYWKIPKRGWGIFSENIQDPPECNPAQCAPRDPAWRRKVRVDDPKQSVVPSILSHSVYVME